MARVCQIRLRHQCKALEQLLVVHVTRLGTQPHHPGARMARPRLATSVASRMGTPPDLILERRPRVSAQENCIEQCWHGAMHLTRPSVSHARVCQNKLEAPMLGTWATGGRTFDEIGSVFRPLFPPKLRQGTCVYFIEHTSVCL